MTKHCIQKELNDEAVTLRKEYDWLLKEEIPSQMCQLYDLLVDCSRRFPLHNTVVENIVKPEKFLLNVTNNNNSQENVKCVVTLLGDNIYEAEIQVKVHKHHGQLYKVNIFPDNPWKLQQLQDAGNHLSDAIECVISKRDRHLHSNHEVIMLLDSIMRCLTVGRHCLIMPRKKTIQELQNSRNMKTLTPSLPSDMAVSFYIQSHKLCFAIYHTHAQGSGSAQQIKFDVHQGECLVPWLNEALAMFTVAMQMCQQMKDKVSVFSQYTDVFGGEESGELVVDHSYPSQQQPPFPEPAVPTPAPHTGDNVTTSTTSTTKTTTTPSSGHKRVSFF